MLKNTAESILSRITIDPMTGCGVWPGSFDKDGYPLVKWEGKTTRVTRLVWTLVNGPISEGLMVLHTCDNPKCPNAAHFFLGTALDNSADAKKKGRNVKGLTHGRYTKPEASARGDRHGSKTKPESVPRGERNGQYGKPSKVERDPYSGRFITAGQVTSC